uniref:transmembrane protease serine 9-like n=1 Tax=Ciona intestinalis TaxID=7719 RepID=UPI000521C631|nr:transmembrane protease serine 9-like [Ciona intestinalis]|eukprot:XP_026695733.1 transmembrane protease serine 9-like [Ciona intestinalis]
MKVFISLCALVLLAHAAQSADRIVGGSDVTSTTFAPWQASLQVSGSHFCGGSVISATRIMCAAHCVQSPASSTTVVVGTTDYRFPGQSRQVVAWVAHPSYNSQTIDYDYSMITISALNLNSEVAAIVVASQEYAAGTQALITGWGKTSGGIFGQIPHTLQYAYTSLISQTECKATWGSQVTNRMQCANNNSNSACNGDSGGPLAVNDNGTWKLVGNTSWGSSGCGTSYPSAWSKNSAAYSWITSHMYNKQQYHLLVPTTKNIQNSPKMKVFISLCALVLLAHAAQSADRIVDGADVTSTTFVPWQVSLQKSGSHFCGGSVISATRIMCAAHCVQTPASSTTVVVGTTDYRYPGQSRTALSWLRHPSYNSQTIDYDYSMITVSALTLNSDVAAIEVASQEYAAGTQALITGWGKTSGGIFGQIPDNLQFAYTDLISQLQCKASWGNQVTDRMQCAGGVGVNSGCQGDSGGPLAVNDNGTWKLVGNTSWGSSNCNIAVPSAWSKNSAAYSWIMSHM